MEAPMLQKQPPAMSNIIEEQPLISGKAMPDSSKDGPPAAYLIS